MWHRFASIKYYINVYITVVPKIISHCSFGALFSHRSSFRFLSTALEYFDLNCEDKVLGSKSLHDLFGTANELNEEIRIHGCYHKTKSSDTRKLEELMSVGYLVQAIRARRIFEIGTFVGRMTRILAINA